jgi:hypothetical protein
VFDSIFKKEKMGAKFLLKSIFASSKLGDLKERRGEMCYCNFSYIGIIKINMWINIMITETKQ